jgi:non-ribosomal peptide synthetase component E (peptide arylation enzyme)
MAPNHSLKTISEARLVDDDLNDVDVGKEGEMLVRGPTVFRFVFQSSLVSFH